MRVMDIPQIFKDPDFDLRHDSEEPKFRTGELFRFCVGRLFTICGFDGHGHAEFVVENNRAVRKTGMRGSIWIEPEFLKLVRRAGSANTRTRG